MDRDLTRGPVMRTMLLFAVPMILGNLLQQCYNVADTLIVGRFLGADALAAARFGLYADELFNVDPAGAFPGQRHGVFHLLWPAGPGAVAGERLRLFRAAGGGNGGAQCARLCPDGADSRLFARDGNCARAAAGIPGGHLRGIAGDLFVQLFCRHVAFRGQFHGAACFSGGIGGNEHRPGFVVRAGAEARRCPARRRPRSFHSTFPAWALPCTP